MKKKFKVRVVHFLREKYCIEYCNYWFLPFWWNRICFWFDLGVGSRSKACWSTDLWIAEEAEKIAKKFKSMKDVNEYYKPIQQQRKEYLEQLDQYIERTRPYKSKDIL